MDPQHFVPLHFASSHLSVGGPAYLASSGVQNGFLATFTTSLFYYAPQIHGVATVRRLHGVDRVSLAIDLAFDMTTHFTTLYV
jgi:hypothetical protein